MCEVQPDPGVHALQVCPGAPAGSCAHPGYNWTTPKSMHRDGGLLYASSTDGINFTKPMLKIVEAYGSKANNLVWRTGSGPAQVGVFWDGRGKLFRAFGKGWGLGMGKGMGVASSSDGIHGWTNWTAAPATGPQGDTSNNALWDESLQQYSEHLPPPAPLPSALWLVLPRQTRHL